MFKNYSDELIEEIRINNDIVDVVSEYVRLEKKGKNYFGICPFHKEKTPSFSVEAGKQIFYCFGCGKGGNVIHFISLIEKLDYVESIKYLADRAKIALPEDNDEEQLEKSRKRQLVSRINLIAARYFNDVLNSKQGEKGAAYLKKRKISSSIARRFGLGYSTEDWDGLYKHLIGQGIKDDEALLSGLVLKSSKGTIYDRFRGRLMFPIFDVRGNVIGFGGRVLDNSLPKYMNSPETPVYSKGKHLYALNFAKNSGSKKLIVVEGYMDVISLHQSGINNAVASLGTALTESQGRVLKKYAEEIIISYDADTAGQAATQRGLEILSNIGCNVKVLTVPDGKDPDEYIRNNGAEGFKKLVSGALSLVEYKIKALRKEHDLSTTDGRIAFLNRAAAVLAKIDNVMEREMYIKKLSSEYEVSEEAILTEIMRMTKPSSKQKIKVVSPVEAVKRAESTGGEVEWKLDHDEKFILSLLCADNSIYSKVKEQLNVEMFTSGENKRIAGIVLEGLEKKKEFSPAELLDIVENDKAGEFARILNEECHCDDNLKVIWGKIKDIKVLRIERRQKQILDLLRDEGNLPEGDVDRLKKELKGLLQKIIEIKKSHI
jgi:DNA primase